MQVKNIGEFQDLFRKFKARFVDTAAGQEEIKLYERVRQIGQQNFAAIQSAFAEQAISRSEQITEDLANQVLWKLLPHATTGEHKGLDLWVHHRPIISNGDIKTHCGADGSIWDWKAIAYAVFHFIESCLTYPQDLSKICQNFCKLPYGNRFEANLLTPILNALRPEEFQLIDYKQQEIIGTLFDIHLSCKLIDYPDTNQQIKTLIHQLASTMQGIWNSGLSSSEQFNMFCVWLRAVRSNPAFILCNRYWKIEPGKNARYWDECREQGFIGLGESTQLRTFSKRIVEGDRVIANRGTTEILGIGTVIGPYYYEPSAKHPQHRLPVKWENITPYAVNQPGWHKTLIALTESEFSAILQVSNTSLSILNVNINPDCPFTSTTFDLLSKLHINPKKSIYDEHKQDFKNHLEEPFQHLMLDVAARLPSSIRDMMETRSRIFARIPKNDYGQGGAWDFYWGAFYPKGGKRTEDAQLFLWMNYERLECGFYIGQYGGEQRQRFLENCRIYQADLTSLLQSTLDRENIIFGRRADVDFRADGTAINRIGVNFQEWITDPSASDIHIAAVLSKAQVLSKSREELLTFISQTYQQVFPIALLAIQAEPMSQIQEYVEPAEDISISLSNEVYSLHQCAEETRLDINLLNEWVQAIKRKGQVILYGPPGTGKTYVARCLAKHLLSEGDGLCDLVQFHPAYTYEDFIQGIRPQQGKAGLEYPVVPGRFLEFCEQAQKQQGLCVLIIDEINRANLSQVFGKLMYLLEYREEKANLASGKAFSIPANVRLIGTMNTADRSIAMVDHALRRRFAFLPLYPDMTVLRKFHTNTGYEVEGLIQVLTKVNQAIGDRHYHIGTSFFLQKSLATDLRTIWQMEIEPYLEEYFFDRPEQAKTFCWDSIKNQLSWLPKS